MSLTPGTRLGPYEITAQIGVGGMGEVYRATDTNLARQVALKVLPESTAADAERLARFDREAKTLAALNHPNIAAIYGLERSEVRTALVIELVEGPTLAERIAHGPIPVDETSAIAKQIAEALEAAHSQGIVHRDLKPANVKVRPDGTVKVLDFGLAKVSEPAVAATSSLSMSPTITTPAMTQAGLVLGTAAYMAPEQAKGKEVGKTADIWAFGCVLYEMLTGRPVFDGDDVTEILAAVVRAEPDWTRLPVTTPSPLRTVLRHCLDKDPRRRWQDAASLRIGIEDAMVTPAENAAVVRGHRSAKWLPAIAGTAALASAAIAALAVWNLRPEQPAPAVTRVLLNVSPATEVARALFFPNARPFRAALVLSADGQTLVFVGTPADASTTATRSQRQLYRRTMDRLEATPIEGTENAENPFLSPDGQWVGFWRGVSAAGIGELNKVPIDGGPVVTLARIPLPGGISWGSHGRIVFANHGGGGLWQVPDSGGTPEALTTADAKKGEFNHRLPYVLPGGEAILFTIQRSPNQWDDSQVVVRSLRTGEQKLLVDRAADARYVASGHLVYARMGTLLAQPFDLQRLGVTGEAIALVDNVMQDVNTRFAIGNSGAAQFSVSATGTLAYLPGGVSPQGTYVPVWMDRRGTEQAINVPRVVGAGRVSPDGARIAFSEFSEPGELAVFDVERETFSVLAPGTTPVWHPDGQRLTYTGSRGNLFSIAADGSGAPQELTHFDDEAASRRRLHLATSWSRDGKTLAFVQQDRSTGAVNRDIWMLSSDGATPTVRSFVATSADEVQPVFSPDGHYLAYVSNLSGRPEVYVQPYPGPGKREVISTNGGSHPAWTGKELLYWETGSMTKLMAVDVTLEPTFKVGRPHVLLEWMTSRYPPGVGPRAYDVTPDGKRFLMIQQRDDQSQPPMTHIVLVQNWHEELKRRVPTK